MSVSGISSATAAYAPKVSQPVPPTPPASKVDADGDHDGTKAGGSKRLLDVKA